MNVLFRLCAALAFLLAPLSHAADKAAKAALPQPTEKRIYKEIGDTKLEIWIYKPADWKATDSRSAIVFYHGGGWRGGNPNAFSRQSAKLAERGMVAFSVQYRLTPSGITIAECVKDAKSAFRWVIAHAAELGIDAKKISAGGGSAGGHLAAALATLDDINESTDDLKIATRPASLVLFNPAVKLRGLRAEDNTPGRDAATVNAVDPFSHLKAGHPPTIIFHGENDTTVPIASVREYAAKVKELGGQCDVVGFPEQTHSFFNKEPFVWETLKQAETFLEKQSQLSGKIATAKLLGVRRITPKKDVNGPVDGLTFAVLVMPTGSAAEPALKETRDFRIGGESYQEKTRAALGKTFEPRTEVNDARQFFTKVPALANPTQFVPEGSVVLVVSILGAELPAGADVEVDIQAGYTKKAETFSLRTKVPPGR
ncbi:MAG: alpha/beta hydrolase [Verrucomicrobiota bacterium]